MNAQVNGTPRPGFRLESENDGPPAGSPARLIGREDPVSVQLLVLQDEADSLNDQATALQGLSGLALAQRAGELAALAGDLLTQHREHLAFSQELAGRLEMLEIRVELIEAQR